MRLKKIKRRKHTSANVSCQWRVRVKGAVVDWQTILKGTSLSETFPPWKDLNKRIDGKLKVRGGEGGWGEGKKVIASACLAWAENRGSKEGKGKLRRGGEKGKTSPSRVGRKDEKGIGFYGPRGVSKRGRKKILDSLSLKKPNDPKGPEFILPEVL